MRFAVVLLAVVLLPAADDVYNAPSPEPTPEETLILELMNRCRADPKAESLRMAPPGADPSLPSSTTIDFAMFRDEMAKLPMAPPLVFELRLLAAARKHSWYMIAHGLGHDEDPGKSRFTGKSPSDRVKAAGWNGGGSAEDCYRDARDAWGSQLGFIIDWGPGGPGGMQPGRGHRTNICNPAYGVVGVGALPHDGKLSVTHNLGSDGRRYAGGVTYVDRDHDRFYSLGEGRGGVEVRCGSAKGASWAGGAFTLEIPASACTLSLRAGGVEITRPIPAGTANVKIDWIIPQEQEIAAADKLLAAADAVKDPASSAARKARIALLVGTDGLAVDEARTARIRELTGELATALAADRAAVRDALPGEAKALRAILAERSKPWKGTAAGAWFAEADLSVRAAASYDALPADATPTKLRAIAKELRAAADDATVEEFRIRLKALAAKAEGRLGPGGAGK